MEKKYTFSWMNKHGNNYWLQHFNYLKETALSFLRKAAFFCAKAVPWVHLGEAPAVLHIAFTLEH